MTKIDWNAPKYPETVVLKNIGDTIEGKVTEIGEVILSDRQAGYLHIDTVNGIRTFWLGKVLTEAIEKENVKKGDYIGIKFLGEIDSGKQSPYKDFDMRVIPLVESQRSAPHEGGGGDMKQ